jgi:hypothetical protein|tara:strand:- start:155 stop:532 length:378 start_codon:yes stop_codon:yes gene_type:complete
MSKNNKGIAAQLHLNTTPTKPEVKTQAAGKPMPIIKYIDRMSRLYGSSEVDEYGNPPSATDRIQDPEFFQNKLKNVQKEPIKKAPRMSAKKSWQVIKQSMDKDKPAKLEPVILDPYLTSMLGDDF